MNVAHWSQFGACARNHTEWFASETAFETVWYDHDAPLFVDVASRVTYVPVPVSSWYATPTLPARAAIHGNHLSLVPDVTRMGALHVVPFVDIDMNTFVSVTGLATSCAPSRLSVHTT